MSLDENFRLEDAKDKQDDQDDDYEQRYPGLPSNSNNVLV